MADDPSAAALLYLATHPGATTSDVAKAVFDPDDADALRSADRKVRYYFSDKYPHIIDSDADGKTTYRVDDDLVDAGMGRLEIQSFDGSEFSIGVGGVVVYPDEDDQPQVAVVSELELVDE